MATSGGQEEKARLLGEEIAQLQREARMLKEAEDNLFVSREEVKDQQLIVLAQKEGHLAQKEEERRQNFNFDADIFTSSQDIESQGKGFDFSDEDIVLAVYNEEIEANGRQYADMTKRLDDLATKRKGLEERIRAKQGEKTLADQIQLATLKRKADKTGPILEPQPKKGKKDAEQAMSQESQDFPPVRQPQQNIPLSESLRRPSNTKQIEDELRQFTHPTSNNYKSLNDWWKQLNFYLNGMTSTGNNPDLQALAPKYLEILIQLKHYLEPGKDKIETKNQLDGFYRIVSYITEYYRKAGQPNISDEEMDKIWNKQVYGEKPTKGRVLFIK